MPATGAWGFGRSGDADSRRRHSGWHVGRQQATHPGAEDQQYYRALASAAGRSDLPCERSGTLARYARTSRMHSSLLGSWYESTPRLEGRRTMTRAITRMGPVAVPRVAARTGSLAFPVPKPSWRRVAVATYAGINIALALTLIRTVPVGPDWEQFSALRDGLTSGGLYELSTQTPYIYS